MSEKATYLFGFAYKHIDHGLTVARTEMQLDSLPSWHEIEKIESVLREKWQSKELVVLSVCPLAQES